MRSDALSYLLLEVRALSVFFLIIDQIGTAKISPTIDHSFSDGEQLRLIGRIVMPCISDNRRRD